jgi:hypothetical protein
MAATANFVHVVPEVTTNITAAVSQVHCTYTACLPACSLPAKSQKHLWHSL